LVSQVNTDRRTELSGLGNVGRRFHSAKLLHPSVNR
jgi:hypothetical protein